MAVVNEVITKFGYQGSISPLENFNKGLNQSIKGLLVSVTALAASAAAFNVWAKGVSVSIGEILHLSDETGVAIERIQELGFAASVTGSSNQKLERTLSSLSSKIGEAGQRGNETFQRLGISVRDANGQIKSADRVLFEVGQRFRSLGLSLSEQRTYAEALGIDPSLLKLTKMTGKELAKLTEEAKQNGTLTRRQAKDAEDLNDSHRRLLATYQAMSKQLVATMAPAMRGTVDRIREFILANKELIQDGLKLVIEFVGELIASLIRLAPFLAAAVGVFFALKIATLGWAGALAIVFSPVVLVTAAIAAAILIIDDLIVAFQGGDSVISGIFKDWLGWDIRPALQGLVAAAKWAVDTIKEYYGQIFDIIKNLFTGNFTDAFSGMIDLAKWHIEKLKDIFMPAIDLITGSFKKMMPDWVGEKLFSGDIPKTPTKGDGETSNNGINSTGLANMLPIGKPQGMTTNTSTNVTQDIKIDIKTDNPRIAGEMVKDSLQEQLKDARTQFNRGGV